MACPVEPGVASSLPAVDQVSEAVTDRAGDEQSGYRLLRRILAYEIAGSGTPLVEVCRGLRRLVAGFARHLSGLSHRLPAGFGSLARQCGGAGLGVLDHRFALIECTLHASTRLLRGV